MIESFHPLFGGTVTKEYRHYGGFFWASKNRWASRALRGALRRPPSIPASVPTPCSPSPAQKLGEVFSPGRIHSACCRLCLCVFLPPLDSMEHRRHYKTSLEVSECSQKEAQSNTDCAEYSPSMLQQRHGSAPWLLDFHTTDERAIRREARRPARLQVTMLARATRSSFLVP